MAGCADSWLLDSIFLAPPAMLPILDSLIEAAHEYAASEVRTKPEVKQGES
jgi:hypothetical protein